MTRTYMWEICPGLRSEELADLLGFMAKLSALITDKQTGRSRGFGFVEVADEDADKMIEAMND